MKVGKDCEKILLPDNSHLDTSGNEWECNAGFDRVEDKCIKDF